MKTRRQREITQVFALKKVGLLNSCRHQCRISRAGENDLRVLLLSPENSLLYRDRSRMGNRVVPCASSHSVYLASHHDHLSTSCRRGSEIAPNCLVGSYHEQGPYIMRKEGG